MNTSIGIDPIILLLSDASDLDLPTLKMILRRFFVDRKEWVCAHLNRTFVIFIPNRRFAESATWRPVRSQLPVSL